MNLYHLRYFVTLAHLEHYTKAAQVLSITQPSLSHAIASLEEELGIRLFEKDGRNIVLTKYGQAFLLDVEHALSLLDSSINRLQLTAKGEGNIDIAFLRTLGTSLIPNFIRGFSNLYPDKNIHFSLHTDTGLSADILDGIKTKKYDVAFCSFLENEPLIEFTPIAKQEIVLAVPKDHPLASKDSIHLEETLQYPHIMFKPKSGLRLVVDNLFKQLKQYPDTIAYEVEEDQVAAGLVSQGFGIAVIPYMNILSMMDLKLIQISSPTWERKFYMVTLKNTYQPPAIQNFCEYVKSKSVENLRL